MLPPFTPLFSFSTAHGRDLVFLLEPLRLMLLLPMVG